MEARKKRFVGRNWKGGLNEGNRDGPRGTGGCRDTVEVKKSAWKHKKSVRSAQKHFGTTRGRGTHQDKRAEKKKLNTIELGRKLMNILIVMIFNTSFGPKWHYQGLGYWVFGGKYMTLM